MFPLNMLYVLTYSLPPEKKIIWLRPEDQDEFLIISEATLIYISLWNKAALSMSK